MDQLKARLAELENERQQLNPANTDDVFRIRLIDQEIADIKQQLADQCRKAAEDQKFDELKAIVEAANLNEVLGHPEANKIVHKLLYDQSIQHLQELAEKDDEIKSAHDQISSLAVQHAEELKKVLDEHQATIAENLKLKGEIEDARKDARRWLNESTRYKQQVEDLQRDLAAEKDRRLKEYKPSQTLAEMLEGAKAVTEQRKKKITNVEPVDRIESAYRALDEDGNEITIPHYALKNYEQVSSLPLPEFTTGDIAQQARAVEEAAKEAERFPDVVPSDGAGQAAEDGAGEALEDAETEDQTMTPEEIAARFRRIEEHLGLISWRWDNEGA